VTIGLAGAIPRGPLSINRVVCRPPDPEAQELLGLTP
jgi:hypothetical protein